MQEILTGHNSPETAYVVEDYPYGFRLRCKIRYWLEYRNKYGFRLMSQTTNPKAPGEVWNKPKASTYAEYAVMLLLPADPNNKGIREVSWIGHTCYGDWEKTVVFSEQYGSFLPEERKKHLDKLVQAYKQRKVV